MFDMVQSLTIADSLKFGKAVLNKLGKINKLHKNQVEQAGFAVLKAPDIPSILVETAASVPAEYPNGKDAPSERRPYSMRQSTRPPALPSLPEDWRW